MPKDAFIREKFTKERTAARKFAKDYFERYSKDRYQTEVESWRHLQSAGRSARTVIFPYFGKNLAFARVRQTDKVNDNRTS